MSQNEIAESEPAPGAPARTIMPPHLALQDFLSEADANGLLEFAIGNEAAFTPTALGRSRDPVFNTAIRMSSGTRDLGPYKRLLKDKLRALVPELVAKLRLTPIEEPKFELQLVAHNDGAFYKRHIDTQTAADGTHFRVLSGVYYLHATPRAFTGGALRLHAIGDPGQKTFADVEPAHNTMLVFPSWAPHEVMPVSCPSKRFSHSRFAVNGWAYWKRQDPAAS